MDDLFGSNQPENNENKQTEDTIGSDGQGNTPRTDEPTPASSADNEAETYQTPYQPKTDVSYETSPQNNNGYQSPDGYQAQNHYQTGYGYQNNNPYQSPDGYQNYGGQPYGNGYSQPPYGNQPSGAANGYPPAGNEKKPKKTDKGMRVFIIIIVAIIALAAVLMVAIFTRNTDNNAQPGKNQEQVTDAEGNPNNTGNVGSISATSSSLGAGEAAEVAGIAKQFNVGILIYSNDSLYTEGSGVILKEDNDGKYTYIVTCAHVVNYKDVAISVLMEDGTEYPAELIGVDTRTDLAVIRIEASGLPKAEIADSDELIVGQTVYAVGNPGGSEFFGSVTNGIISAIDRPVSSSTGYEMECIQHTAAINPGNSGGALVNGEGKLIGINSMKIASTEYEGMGFSVPSSVVIEVFNSIIDNGYVAGRAKLGISYTTPSGYSQTYAMYVQMKGLPSGTIVVAEISEDSDLAKQDIQEGDMITKVNGKEMTDSGMLADMIEDMSVGDSLTLTIVRVNTDNWSQTEKNVTVKLVEDKGSSASQEPNDDSDSQQNPFGGSGSGDYEDWYDFFKQYYGY